MDYGRTVFSLHRGQRIDARTDYDQYGDVYRLFAGRIFRRGDRHAGRGDSLVCHHTHNIQALKEVYVRRSLDGVRPAVTGIVCATGLFMLFEALFGSVSNIAVTWQPLVIAFCIAVVMVAYKLLRKKQISPIILIILSAVLGIVVY